MICKDCKVKTTPDRSGPKYCPPCTEKRKPKPKKKIGLGVLISQDLDIWLTKKSKQSEQAQIGFLIGLCKKYHQLGKCRNTI